MLAKAQVRIRWIDDDDPHDPEPEQVARLLRRNHGPDGWTAAEVRRFMESTDHIPKVLVANRRVVGCLFYVLHRHFVMIQHLAAEPGPDRRGHLLRMLDHLKRIMPGLRRPVMAIEVPAGDLELQLLLRDYGFRAIRILHKGTEKESYAMRYVSR